MTTEFFSTYNHREIEQYSEPCHYFEAWTPNKERVICQVKVFKNFSQISWHMGEKGDKGIVDIYELTHHEDICNMIGLHMNDNFKDKFYSPRLTSKTERQRRVLIENQCFDVEAAKEESLALFRKFKASYGELHPLTQMIGQEIFAKLCENDLAKSEFYSRMEDYPKSVYYQ